MTTEVDIKTLFGGPEFRGRSEMPLPGEAGGVARLPEGLRKRVFFKIHTVVEGCRPEATPATTGEEIGGVRAGRMTARHDGVAGG